MTPCVQFGMYATCLFCNRPLGTNQTFEAFPVGRRFAFDPTRGRLWVVCEHCERWNLTPLEERWETIEAADRLYREARRRVATDNIGLARLSEGTTLVRIGPALRPEFAGWRYGDQFGRRRRRQMLIAGAGVGALGAVAIGGATVGVGIGAFAGVLVNGAQGIIRGGAETVVARIRTPTGETLRVRRRHLAETRIVPGQNAPLAVELRYAGGQSHFEGPEAMRIAALVVPAVNRFGGSKRAVAEAVSEIESAGGPEGFLEQSARMVSGTRSGRSSPSGRSVQFAAWGGFAVARIGSRRRGRWGRDWNTGLFALNPVHRLALEMALHEDVERAALEGELEDLERAWRDAEEIAAIADDMFVPSGVRATLSRLRERR